MTWTSLVQYTNICYTNFVILDVSCMSQRHTSSQQQSPLFLLFLLGIQYKKAQHEKTNHHGKCRRVVGICSEDKAFIFIVAVWTNGNLFLYVDDGQTLALVVNDKFKHPIHIRDVYHGGKSALGVFVFVCAL